MSKEAADKQKAAKPAKPAKQAQAGEEKKAEEAGKPAPEAAAEKEVPKEEKPKPAPRPPADPRLKVLKKFYGKFLPRGPLRDRHKALDDALGVRRRSRRCHRRRAEIALRRLESRPRQAASQGGAVRLNRAAEFSHDRRASAECGSRSTPGVQTEQRRWRSSRAADRDVSSGPLSGPCAPCS